MIARRYLSIGIIVFAVCVERAAYYLFRSQLALLLRTMFLEMRSDIGHLFALFSWAVLLGMLAGGGLAFKIGPRMSAIVGFAISLFALLLIAVFNAYDVLILLYAFGVGFIKPAAYAYAAEVFSREDDDAQLPSPSPRRFFALGAVVCALFAMANAGSSYGPLYGRQLELRFGLKGVVIGTFVLMLVAGAGFLATLISDPAQKAAAPGTVENTAYRTAPAASAVSATASNGLVVAALFTMTSTVFMCTASGSWSFSTVNDRSLGFVVIVETLTAFVLFAVLASQAGKRSSTPLAIYYGVGLLGAGVFSLVGLLPSAPLMTVAGLAGALFEPLASLGVVFAAIAGRGKSATILVAAFLGAQTMGNAQLQPFLESQGRVVVALGSITILGCAIAILVNARKIQRAYEPQTRPAQT